MADPNEAGGWVVDPANPNRATYTDETGKTYEAIKDTPPAQPEERGAFQRLTDSFNEAGQHGFPGLVARKWYDWTDYGINELKKQNPGHPDDYYEAQADKLISTAQRGLQEEMAAKQAADPSWKPDASFWDKAGAIDKWGPYLAGQVLGSAGPESLVNPGGTALARVGAQGAMGGGTDLLYQELEKNDGVRDDINLWQTLGSTAAAAGLQGVFEIPGFVTKLFKERGVDTTPGATPEPIKTTGPSEDFRQQYADLLNTGSYGDIMTLVQQHPELHVDPNEVASYLKARDANAAQQANAENVYNPQGQAQGELQLPSNEPELALNQNGQVRPAPAKPEVGVRPEHVEAAVNGAVQRVDELTKDWKNRPEIEVHENFDNLPDVDPDAIGVTMPDGKVAINMKNIPDADTLHAVVFHEGLGHHGLAQKFGQDLDDILDNMYANSTSFQSKVDKWMERNPDAYAEDLNPHARAAEEVLAEMSEAGRIPATMMDKFRNWVKSYGRQMGLDIKYSDREVKTVLAMAHDATVNGKGRDVVGNGFKYKRNDEGPGYTQDDLAWFAALAEKDKERDARKVIEQRMKARQRDDFKANMPGNRYKKVETNPEAARTVEERRRKTTLDKVANYHNQNAELGKTTFTRPYSDEPRNWSFSYTDPKTGKPVNGSYELNPNGKIENFSIGLGDSAPAADLPGLGIKTKDTNANRLGPTAVRDIARAIKKEHPNATTLDGLRISGARGKPEDISVSLMRYMKKRSVGKGSEGPLQGGTDEEGNNLGVGKFRSNRNIEGILAEGAPEPTKESWDDWISEANGIRNQVKTAKGLKSGSEPAEVLAARTAIVKSANRIADLSRKAADGKLSEREEYQLLAEMTRNADMQDALAGVRSNAARIVNSFKINVESDDAFADSIRNMMKALPNNVLNNAANRQKFFQQVGQNAANPTAVNKLIRASMKPKAEDYIFRAWYNMLLSHPATHTANFIGTGANVLADLLEKTGAAVAGQGKRFSNADRIRGREVAYRVYGILQGMKDAQTWKNTRESLNTGEVAGSTNPHAGNSSVYTGNGKIAGFTSGVVEAPSRALAGADEWWRNVLQASNMHGLAVRNAGNKGLKGQAFWDEVNNLIANPTPEMIAHTNDYTKVIQFMDKPSGLARGMMAVQNPNVTGRVISNVVKFAVPFVRTPDALIRTTIRRSGVLGPLERENINGWKKGGAERDQVKARLIMGSALAFWVATQAMKGDITGAGPTDFKKNKEWAGTHQPNSIKVGKDWYSIQGLEPVSTNISGIATLVEQYKAGEISKDDYLATAANLAMGIGSVLKNNSYFDGFTNLLDTTDSDPDKAQTAATNFLSNIAASAVTPAIVRGYTQAEDTAERDTTGDGSIGDRIKGRIEAAFPGLSTELPQKYDVYGQPQERNIAGPDMATRVRTRPETADPAIAELGRLSETTDKVIVGAPKKTGIKVNGVETKLNAEQYQKYQHLSGYWIVESVRAEMATDEWKNASDSEKISIIKDITQDMRKAARDTLFDPEDEVPEEGEVSE